MRLFDTDMFYRIHDAATQGRSVELSAAEVNLLQDLCGDALAQAESELLKWKDRYEEFSLESSREEED